MSMKRDRINNELVIPFLVNAHQSSGVTGKNTASFDAWNPRSMPSNILVMVLVADWAAAGTLDFRFQDSDDNVTFTTHKTAAQATGAAGSIFIFEVDDYKRYIRLNYDSSHPCTLSVVGTAARGRREPVTQLTGTVTLAVT